MRHIITSLLARAGVTVNGSSPWDIQVHDSRFYREALLRGSLGLGESYMNGWWDCQRLDEFFYRVLKARSGRFSWLNPRRLLSRLQNLLVNRVSRQRAFDIAEAHYDIGNDLFQAMLDPRMTYTCAYWTGGATTLAAAQEAKLDLVCKKLNLRRGQKILDIGCGWGSWARFAAERYGVSVVGITVAAEQVKLARELSKGLPIEYRLQDYREVDERFDHIVSLGMFEHVEAKNHRQYFEVVKQCLKPGGLFLLHTIGVEKGKDTYDPWMRKYIFPVGTFPSRPEILAAAKNVLHILDWHDLGSSNYDRTLLAWHENFVGNWAALQSRYASRVGGRFQRMWEYYLLACAGMFRAGRSTVYHIVLSDTAQAYQPVR